MAVKVRWSPRAAADLERICDHIGQDSETYAALFARRVVSLVEGLAEFPRSGRVVPEYGIETLREKVAAKNCRLLGKRGVTLRKTTDVLIATFLIERGFRLLHNDADFDAFEKQLGLQVLRASGSPK